MDAGRRHLNGFAIPASWPLPVGCQAPPGSAQADQVHLCTSEPSAKDST
jgi:hypothetical protein